MCEEDCGANPSFQWLYQEETTSLRTKLVILAHKTLINCYEFVNKSLKLNRLNHINISCKSLKIDRLLDLFG